jgi:hypothetical protein
MNEALQTWRQMTFEDLEVAISSRESADGPTLFGSPDGPMTDQSGLALAPASRTRQRGSRKATPTPAISGPICSGSSASADLTRFLVSKLKERFATGGSMEFVETWKEKATPLGRPYWAHTASARRTSASDCSGWPTPDTGSDGGRVSSDPLARTRASGTKKALTINEAAQLASWPTPNACERGPELDKSGRPASGGIDLQSVAQLAAWPTPMAGSPETENYNAAGNTDASRKTVDLVAGWATPRAEDAESSGMRHSRGTADTLTAQAGQDLTSSTVVTEKRGVLNPDFSRWLMGYPAAWGSCADTAMQSFQKRRRSL